ncbi:MAG TPA: kelch repeat-containing protein [Thermoanaerobaculia bacterium]|nr:kelch repeat-containing protein [Thermoanaerobaculia bacterium]
MKFAAVLFVFAVSAQAAFVPTNGMPEAFVAPATTLADGRVLFTQPQYVLATKAAIYNPQTQSFTYVADPLHGNQVGQSATRLRDGKVLIAGGGFQPLGSRYKIGGVVATIFNPATDTFNDGGILRVERSDHAAVLLADGRVFICGGQVVEGGGGGFTETPTATAEIYDPATSTSRLTTPMRVARGTPSAVLLVDGRVLIVGGAPSASDPTAEIFDPLSETYTIAPPMIVPRRSTLATHLPNGDVLITGGLGYDSSEAIASAELYVHLTGRFEPNGEMTTPRVRHNAVLLPNGRVFIGGGAGTAEVFDPKTHAFNDLGLTLFLHNSGAIALLPDKSVLIAGGTQFTERFIPPVPIQRIIRRR